MTSTTVITVCFNAADTIERTIQSVAEQSTSVDQYIIIDGRSNDGTVDIITKYNHSFQGRLQFISEPDTGIYNAMNKGIKMAKGDIIGILNADDWYENNAVETVIKAAHNNKAGIFYGMVRKWINGKERAVMREHHNFLENDNIPHPASFISRSIYDQYGEFDEQYALAADYELMLRLYKRGVNFYPIDRILTNFAVGGASLKQARKMWIETVKIQRRYNTISPAKYYMYRILIEARAFIERFVLKERILSA